MNKICGICGDKANARHFGAISCDCCKAFFRTFAPKNQELIRSKEENERLKQVVINNRLKQLQCNESVVSLALTVGRTHTKAHPFPLFPLPH
ncbi:unnamed protein product, partial [Medioppia subpectinata]